MSHPRITWRDRFRAFFANCRRDPVAAWVEFGLLMIAAGLILLLCSCAKDRAQVAADNRARVQGAELNLAEVVKALIPMREVLAQLGEAARPHLVELENGLSAIARAQANLQHADASMPAVADVPSSDLPAPAQTPAELAAHPERDTPAPEPSGSWGKVVGGLTAGGLGLLFLLGRVAPAVFPGAGTVVGGVANAAWSLLAHRDQKQSDRVAGTVTGAAQDLAPIVQAIAAAPPEDLPPWLADLLTDGRRAAAVQLVQTVASPAAPRPPSA